MRRVEDPEAGWKFWRKVRLNTAGGNRAVLGQEQYDLGVEQNIPELKAKGLKNIAAGTITQNPRGEMVEKYEEK